ncbi:hypothetical protein JYG30_19705 [Fibrella sp. USSR17]
MQKSIATDSTLNVDFLLKEKYFNFEIEDWYGHNIYTRGKTRKFIIESLFKIYYKWSEELLKLNTPFYLAIWLYDPWLLRSEVVCAIDDKITYYEEEAFMVSKKTNVLDLSQYGSLLREFSEFDWTRKVHLEYFLDWEKKYHKKRQLTHTIEREAGKMYFYSQGDVWIGKAKS